MAYTRQQMINQFILTDIEYATEDEERLREDHPEHTVESFVQALRADYEAMTDEALESYHRMRLSGYYEDAEDVEPLLSHYEASCKKEFVKKFLI